MVSLLADQRQVEVVEETALACVLSLGDFIDRASVCRLADDVIDRQVGNHLG